MPRTIGCSILTGNYGRAERREARNPGGLLVFKQLQVAFEISQEHHLNRQLDETFRGFPEENVNRYPHRPNAVPWLAPLR
jgi:hypothetical protein